MNFYKVIFLQDVFDPERKTHCSALTDVQRITYEFDFVSKIAPATKRCYENFTSKEKNRSML